MSRTTRKKFKGKSEYWALSNSRIMYDFKFAPILSYLENTQSMINELEQELNENYDNWDKEHSHNPEMPPAFDVFEEEIMNSSKFPSILNQSIYLTIYSMFEDEFLKLCTWCQRAERLKIGPKDLNGQGGYIEQCRKYITKVIDINLDDLNETWKEIKKYQLIRNSIAHNNGIIKSPNKDILTFIKNSKGITFDTVLSKIEMKSIDFLKILIEKLSDYLSETAEIILKEKNK